MSVEDPSDLHYISFVPSQCAKESEDISETEDFRFSRQLKWKEHF